jgi:hypothetical protein
VHRDEDVVTVPETKGPVIVTLAATTVTGIFPMSSASPSTVTALVIEQVADDELGG